MLAASELDIDHSILMKTISTLNSPGFTVTSVENTSQCIGRHALPKLRTTRPLRRTTLLTRKLAELAQERWPGCISPHQKSQSGERWSLGAYEGWTGRRRGWLFRLHPHAARFCGVRAYF